MRLRTTGIALLVMVSACGGGSGSSQEETGRVIEVPPPPAEPMQFAAPPQMSIDVTADYLAAIVTTEGEIVIDLFEDTAPETVNNFVFLARQGFYDGVIFHRVVPGFVIQGGDPTGTGRGGPGYRFADELDAPQPYARGIVAMANSGPDTNGSQFFIMHADSGLPYAYSIFGEVVEGMETVDAIAAKQLQGERPVDDVSIVAITITGP